GPHSHYWFTIQPQSERRRLGKKRVVPTLNARPELKTLLDDGERARLEAEVLPEYISACRWFGAKARTLRQMRVRERSAISSEAGAAQFWFVEVSYLDGPTESYTLPVKIASGEKARAILQSAPQAVIARFSADDEPILFDAVRDADFREKLFRLMSGRGRAGSRTGNVVGALNPA